MKCPSRPLTLMVLLFLGGSSGVSQTVDRDLRPRTASISGRVMLNGKPAANLRVQASEEVKGQSQAIIYMEGGREMINPIVHAAMTDAEGRYRLSKLPAGNYIITPHAQGYTSENLAPGENIAIKITLDEGESRENINFSLVRGGVITGQVTDEDGRLMIDRMVRLKQELEPGKFSEPIGSGVYYQVSNDLGVYRLFGLPKGRYLVYSGGENSLRYAINGKETQVTYHPDVVDEKNAVVIEVPEGGEISGVDLRLRNPAESFTASGRLILAETGAPLAQTTVYCFIPESPEDGDGNWERASVTDQEGKFTLRRLKPGRYKLKVYQGHQNENPFNTEAKSFEVVDGDVNGLNLEARVGAAINGRIIIAEGREAFEQSKQQYPSINIQLYRETKGASPNNIVHIQSFHKRPDPDGRFRIIGSPPGKATLMTGGGSLYLLGVEGVELDPNKRFEIEPGAEIKDVRVITGYGRSSIHGVVKVEGGALPPKCYLSVTAIRVAQNEASYIGRAAEVDEKGRFEIEGLLSGAYDVSVTVGARSGHSVKEFYKNPPSTTQRISLASGADSQVSLNLNLSANPEGRQ
jgi:hypothetical protein